MDKKISHYVTVAHWTSEDLSSKVNDLIRSGYEPLGGLALGRNAGDRCTYAQALVKYDTKPVPSAEDIAGRKLYHLLLRIKSGAILGSNGTIGEKLALDGILQEIADAGII
jgi:hypothetical protein